MIKLKRLIQESIFDDYLIGTTETLLKIDSVTISMHEIDINYIYSKNSHVLENIELLKKEIGLESIKAYIEPSRIDKLFWYIEGKDYTGRTTTIYNENVARVISQTIESNNDVDFIYYNGELDIFQLIAHRKNQKARKDIDEVVSYLRSKFNRKNINNLSSSYDLEEHYLKFDPLTFTHDYDIIIKLWDELMNINHKVIPVLESFINKVDSSNKYEIRPCKDKHYGYYIRITCTRNHKEHEKYPTIKEEDDVPIN